MKSQNFRYSSSWLSPVKRFIVAATILLFLCVIPAAANTIYISQSGGPFSGGSACNGQATQTVTYFNTSGNWTSGTPTGTQIGPGTTVYLCGTITSTLTFRGSGSSGNNILLKFDSGANMTKAVWNPDAIELNQENYITIDGGTPCGVTSSSQTTCSANLTGTGIIQNTANGTLLANQVGSFFIVGATGGANNGCGHDVEIRNLLLLNDYVKSGIDTSAGAQGQAFYLIGCGNNWYIHDSTSTFGHALFSLGASASVTNWDISNNVAQHGAWGVVMADGNPGVVPTNWKIHDNDINLYNDWSEADGTYHLDGIFVFGYGSTGYPNGVYVYNNYVHGNWITSGSGQCPTGYIFLDQNIANAYVFNNVISPTGGSYGCNGIIALGPANSNNFIANNTMIGASNSSSQAIGSLGPETAFLTIYNNIISTFNGVTDMRDAGDGAIIASNYNDFYNLSGSSAPGVFCAGPSNCFIGSLTSWQAHTSTAATSTGGEPDANSTTGNPNVASRYPYTLGSGSAAIGLGKNLYSVCNGQPNPGLGALCYDKAGVARPPSGNWDAGAYNSGTTSVTVQPPSGLTASVQ